MAPPHHPPHCMAHIYKQRDKWRAQVQRKGQRVSKSFRTKAEAILWAQSIEAEILQANGPGFPRKTFADAIERYKRDVSSTKKGERHECMRLDAFVRDFPHIAGKLLTEVKTSDMVSWRDARLKEVTPASVSRTVSTFSNLFRYAIKEWGWCGHNPCEDMKSPGDNPPRTRRVAPSEVKTLCRWLGYRTGEKPSTKMQEVALAFLVSLRTGMRAGEVLQLGSATVDLDKGVARVTHKTQHITGTHREVPLSPKAVRLLRPVMAERIFSVSSASLDALFRKAKANTLIQDLHFHDARAEALTRFAKKVDVLTLARISGHRDLRVLFDHYYRETAEDISRRLG